MFMCLLMQVRGRAGEPPAGSLSLDADSIKPIATLKKLSSLRCPLRGSKVCSRWTFSQNNLLFSKDLLDSLLTAADKVL